MSIYPLRKGFAGTAPDEVVQAVKNVIADWDGKNWVTVRHCIATTMTDNSDLDDWSMEDVRQRFALGQRKMTIELGGRVNTTDASIIPVSYGTICVQTGNLSQRDIADATSEWSQWEPGDLLGSRTTYISHANSPEHFGIRRTPKDGGKRFVYEVHVNYLAEYVKPGALKRKGMSN